MKVICISAKARHGKDTSALILKELYEGEGKKVLIIHYADLLKFICTQFFGWDGNKDEKGRSILQHVGSDNIRPKNPNYLVNFVIEFLSMFRNEWDYVLIPDCRFPNEVLEIAKYFDVSVIRIERPNFDNGLTEKQKQHSTETALDNFAFDAIIKNDGSIETLKEKLKGLIL